MFCSVETRFFRQDQPLPTNCEAGQIACLFHHQVAVQSRADASIDQFDVSALHAEMAARLAPIARQLGIEDLLDKYPYEVSGGQKQRAAVARALITKPEIVLADEPTGALDSKATTKLLHLFGEINRGGQTILMVTHSTRAASHAGRVLFIKDGVVFHQLYRGNMTSDEMFAKIGDTLTMLTTGGADRG